MAKRITGLGRGLEALLPADDINNRLQQMKKNASTAHEVEGSVDSQGLLPSAASSGSGVQELPLAAIKPATEQPRRFFDELTISELAQSIFEHGLLQPILVMPLKPEELLDGGIKYRIIAGERRFRACQVLKWQRIPAIVKTVSDVELFELALIENIQREDLTPIDEALAYEHLLRISGLSQQEMAKRLGKGRSALANSLRLLQLPPEVQQGLSQGLIRSGHAKALLMIKDAEALAQAYRLCVEESWSVRKVESYCQQWNSATAEGAETAGEFQDFLGTPATTPSAVSTTESAEALSGDLHVDESYVEIDEELQSELAQLDNEQMNSIDEAEQGSIQVPTEHSGESPGGENPAEEAGQTTGTEPNHAAASVVSDQTESSASGQRAQLGKRPEPKQSASKQPEYWGVRGMLFRQEELEGHLTKALQVGLHLRLEGNLHAGQSQGESSGVSSAARPRKALLQVEFESQEQWEQWLKKLGLDEILTEDEKRLEHPEGTAHLQGKALFS